MILLKKNCFSFFSFITKMANSWCRIIFFVWPHKILIVIVFSLVLVHDESFDFWSFESFILTSGDEFIDYLNEFFFCWDFSNFFLFVWIFFLIIIIIYFFFALRILFDMFRRTFSAFLFCFDCIFFKFLGLESLNQLFFYYCFFSCLQFVH